MADRLSKPEAVQRVMAADEPCRDVFARTLDLQESRDPGMAKVSGEGEPICRTAYRTLNKINIFVPQKDFTDERLKRDMIKSCANLSKARADLLSLYAGPSPDDAKRAVLQKELALADTACQNQFKTLASRV